MAAGLGFKDFTTGEVLTAADVDGYLMQGIWVFTNATARDAAVTSPQEGNFAFTKDNNSLWYYDGAAWVASGATGDIEGVTAGIGISGGGTSGTVTVTNSMATAIDAKGDLIAGTGADTFAKLTVGANGTTLVADSSEATGLKWQAAASSGGMTLITETVASSNSSISFTGISGSYKQLLLVWQGIQHSSSGSKFSIRLNNDSSALYSLTQWGMEANSPTSQELNNQTDIGDAGNDRVPFGIDANGATYSLAVKGQLLVDNYASTSKFKYFDVTWGNAVSSNANNKAFRHYGTYRSTSAITSVDIVRLTGTQTLSNLTSTSIRLYGIS